MNLKGIIDKNKNNDTEEDQKSEKEPAKVRPILAELGHIPGTGTIKMTLVSAKAVEEKSISSINNAMILIKEFSRMVGDSVGEIPFECGPSQVDLGFNILFTTDGKAVITKSEKEKNLKVTLTWKRDEKDREKKEENIEKKEKNIEEEKKNKEEEKKNKEEEYTERSGS